MDACRQQAHPGVRISLRPPGLGGPARTPIGDSHWIHLPSRYTSAPVLRCGTLHAFDVTPHRAHHGTPSLMRCLLIGDQRTLTLCGEVLRENGDDLVGVVTDSELVREWAAGHGVPCWAAAEAAADGWQRVRAIPCDLLFSIANLRVLPAALLQHPARGAINFHDGPLPAYAGLNAPNWGLIHGETDWQVTWHWMTDEVDGGRILATGDLSIGPQDTGLTLNLRCMSAAVGAFGPLVERLAAAFGPGGDPEGVAGSPQREVPGRTFLRVERPEGGGVLDWRRSAAELDRLVRALDFGDYENPLTTPKVLWAGRLWSVTGCRPEPGAGVPGEVLSAGGDGIVVAAGEGALRLTGLTDDCGAVVPLPEGLPGLAEGIGLPVLTDGEFQALQRECEQLARGERKWVRRLLGIEPLRIPGVSRQGGRSEVVLPLRLPSAMPAAEGRAALIAGLVRLAEGDPEGGAVRHLGLRCRPLAGSQGADPDAARPSMAAPVMPLEVSGCASECAKDFGARIQAALQELDGLGPWPRDLPGRTPLLSHLRGVPLRFPVQWEECAGDAAAQTAGAHLGDAEVLVRFHDGDSPKLYLDSLSAADGVGERLQGTLQALLDAAAEDPGAPMAAQEVLRGEARRQVLEEWNDTAVPVPEASIHGLIAQQMVRTPDAVACRSEGDSKTYRALDHGADQIARVLRDAGVGPGDIVGVHLDRGIAMVEAVLGILRVGAAYLPLDPAYPLERVRFMVEDSGARAVFSQRAHSGQLEGLGVSILLVDGSAGEQPLGEGDVAPAVAAVAPGDLAYVIYTSGSTGRPKGVLVEHRNAVNFFVGMDQTVPVTEGSAGSPGVWLAVTSLSFDISVLELLWTLTRGFEVVIHRSGAEGAALKRPVDFGLFYFSSDAEAAGQDRYGLLLESAKFADAHGFSSIWTPERHFHAFGGLFPNPAVTGAAVAAVTERLAIRSGSIVLPLHHPVRVAEDWAIVDNLCGGRVGLSIAPGWQPVDFVIRPEAYGERHQQMFAALDTVQRLWRGEEVEFPDAEGVPRKVRTQPRPIQTELPIWVTAAGSPETFRKAGEQGANVLTHLLGQTVGEIGQKVAVYREARRAAGHPGPGIVSVMLHTFVGTDLDTVRDTVREPMIAYLGSALSLVKGFANTWAAFKRRADGTAAMGDVDLDELEPDELRDLLEFSFERYFETSAMLGTPDKCVDIVRDLAAEGVDEVACLVDFGVPRGAVLEHLPHLDEVRRRCVELAEQQRGGIPDLIEAHGVTHLQCTPSMIRMLLEDPLARQALARLRTLLLGGEALPQELVARLREWTDATILNMYGPTETTVWSTTHKVEPGEPIRIGKPIANTLVYVLDRERKPLGVGLEGELWIGGEGVVRGYHGRPELTGERFVPDPFASGDSARMYRTGDLVRWHSSGCLEYLGRIDQQIKIRGHRIESGEIESALVSHPGVAAAAVAVRAIDGDPRLFGWVVLETGIDVGGGELREWLQARLPEPMVPSQFLRIDALPLTPNLKVDRKALPDPRTAEALDKSSDATLDGPEERALAAIWCEVLGLGTVGRDDDFFGLGGHSILAVQAARVIGEAWQTHLRVLDLFRTPKLADLAAKLGPLPAETAQESQPDRGAVAVAPPATTGAPVDLWPDDGNGQRLTPAQARLWFLEELSPGTPLQNYLVKVSFDGPLDVPRLKAALEDLQERHVSLRTVYRAVAPGDPRQLVLDAPPLDWSVAALTGELSRVAAAEAKRPFVLGEGPVWRTRLLRLGESEHVLLFHCHHIAVDGWSMRVLVQDLVALYRAREGDGSGRHRGPSTLALPPAPSVVEKGVHRQVSPAQRELDLEHWRRVFPSDIPAVELPTQGPRIPHGVRAGAHLPLDWPHELTERLESLAQQHGASLYMVLMGVLQAVLHRYSGQRVLVVGSPIAERGSKQVEHSVGLMLNLVPIATQVEPTEPFRFLLERVQGSVLAAFDHAATPFDQVVKALEPDRAVGRSPFFDVMFEFDGEHLAPVEVGGLTVTLHETPVSSGTAKFDLTLDLRRNQDGHLRGWLEFDTSLFQRDFAERFAAHLRAFAEIVSRQPEALVGDVPLEPSGEQGLRGPEVPEVVLAPPTIHGAFAGQVARTPDAVALTCRGRSWTWAQLDQAAERVAQGVREALGGAPGEDAQLVGIATRRDRQMVAGLLGILKAGCAYLPLDPEYPEDRLQLMLRDSAAPLVLVDGDTPAEICAGCAAKQLNLDDLFRAEAAVDGTPLDLRARSETPTLAQGRDPLAYVIYTSGSTGVPKGVMVGHREAANLFAAFDQVLGTGSTDGGAKAGDATWVSVTSISFDISVLELFWSLSRGVQVVLQPEGRDPDQSPVALAKAHRATHLQCTPSQLRMLLADPDAAAALGGIQKLLVGGEALPPDLAAMVLPLLAGNLINVYGPTETTVWSACHVVTEEDQRTVPIGAPIANTSLYVLDEHRRQVPRGVQGELWIGGAGVTQGYLNRPELSAERFVEDPFGSASPSGEGARARMYRTGDLVRELTGGGGARKLEFVGRADGQVKLRGHRLELGEIEALLAKCGGVREAAAIVREDTPGDQRLVAYVVTGSGYSEAATRAALAESLPEAVLPNAYVQLDAMPLTPNGKLDRRSLPAPRVSARRIAAADGGVGAAPRDDVEERLAAVWRETLASGAVGIHQDFFKIGGHSLLALELAARISKEFGREFPLAQVFAATTIAEQGALLQASQEVSKRAMVPLNSSVGQERLPIHCLCGVNLYQSLAVALGDEQPVQAMYVPEEEALFGGGQMAENYDPQEALGVLAKAYWEMIRADRGDGPVRLMGFCFGGALAYEVALLAEAEGVPVAQLVLLDAVIWKRLKRNQVLRIRNRLRTMLRAGSQRALGRNGKPAGANVQGARSSTNSNGNGAAGDRIGGERLAMLANRMFDYDPKGRVQAPTLLVRTDDPKIYASWRVTGQLGWEGHLAGSVETLVLHSDHLGVLKEPCVDKIAASIHSQWGVRPHAT